MTDYDFIVVGAGPAGAVLASRLAHSSKASKVLLLDAGGPNDASHLRSKESRWSIAFTEQGLDWGYISVPQPHLNNREIPLARGKGLGGSSATNFACWIIGDKNDFDEWASETGDECWNWKNVQHRFRKIEKLHLDLDETQVRFLDEKAQQAHSKDGRVDLIYNKHWPGLEEMTFKAAKQADLPLNGDINSGDPKGWGIGPATYYHGRVTASTAYLSSAPKNLTILTNQEVARVILDRSSRATGVETVAGAKFYAAKEVILSAGAFNSPKILLLSGIGPSAQLSKFSIPPRVDLPGVGEGLKDHSFFCTTILLKSPAAETVREPPTSPPNESNPLLARIPHSGDQCAMGWFSSPEVKNSKEFSQLDDRTKAFLEKVPSFENMTNNIPITVQHLDLNGAPVVTFLAAIMNPQASGSVRLSSANPKDAPLVDPQYCAHPYDRRVAIECMRQMMRFARQPVFAEQTERFLDGPQSDSDEDIWEFYKAACMPVWHYSSTCKMGKDDDATAVVNRDFSVRGCKGLRVVDMSVCPVLPNNHTQSTAYLIGETAAEKLIAEYASSELPERRLRSQL